MNDRARKLKWLGLCYLYCMKQHESRSTTNWLKIAESYLKTLRDDASIDATDLPPDYDDQMQVMHDFVFGD